MVSKALADPAGVKIMAMLLKRRGGLRLRHLRGYPQERRHGQSPPRDPPAHPRRPICVADVVNAALEDSGLAVSERRGTWVHYRAVVKRVAAVGDALALGR
jgi:DNA-binding transcriptional ArsR family regulator